MKWSEIKATGSYEGELERDRVYLESGEGKRREREALRAGGEVERESGHWESGREMWKEEEAMLTHSQWGPA